MADNVTNELLLETLKAIQAKLSDVAGDIVDLKADIRGLKGHLAAFMQSEIAQDGAIASIQLKIERIEQRLISWMGSRACVVGPSPL
ncbi:hypothetical protein [Methylocystis sp.]|uniref:hypothetical protein n=1 Tax=Methylocystis sp. TaxID=1911079 RepID=UPI0027348A19|nr:hypothetical protein [Methylocystis sp.]MDP3552695.1 hypothetical protein [Methylocystis sp.]